MNDDYISYGEGLADDKSSYLLSESIGRDLRRYSRRLTEEQEAKEG
jgi:hypothetical protein